MLPVNIQELSASLTNALSFVSKEVRKGQDVKSVLLERENLTANLRHKSNMLTEKYTACTTIVT